MKVKRVVIDTNVLISATLSSRSTPARVVFWALEQGRLVFSAETFAELESRLWRPKFDRYLSQETRRQLLHDLNAVAERVTLPVPPGLPYSRDPDDDKFIHTAQVATADWLISGDADLLELPVIKGLTILSPAQALALVEPHPQA
jgi:putative PIN family toxin of toxin-antitoxin system